MKSELRACDHEGVAHVVAGVSHIGEFPSLQFSEMLPDGQHVGQHLRRMIFIGQTVPHRNACIGAERLYDLLAETAVFDSVIDASQHAGSIRDALFLADLGSAGIQIGDMHSEIIRCDLEGAAGTGTGLLEDQSDILACMETVLFPRFFHFLQFCRAIQHIGDLFGGEVLECQKITSF